MLMLPYRKTILLLAILSSFYLSNSCGVLAGNPEEDDETNQSSPKSPITFFITDAPVDNAKEVWITVKALKLHHSEKGWIDIPLTESESINLLELQNGNSLSFAAKLDLEPATYNQTRLELDPDSDPKIVLLDGTQADLKIPSGSSSGIKIVTPFTHKENEETNITIDFDLRKSIKQTGNENSNNRKYMMKPVLRLIKNDESAKITIKSEGTVACIYRDDSEMDETDECSQAISSSNIDDGKFIFGFMSAGTYNIRIFNGNGSYNDINNIEIAAGKDVVINQ